MARTGRELQRYGEEGDRLIACCIPVRSALAVDGSPSIQIMLISSQKGDGYVFPKGGWECDETLEAAATRETYEEAGIRGDLERPHLVSLTFEARKPHAYGTRCRVYVFLMHVKEELESWPERASRTREWVCVSMYCSLCCMYLLWCVQYSNAFIAVVFYILVD